MHEYRIPRTNRMPLKIYGTLFDMIINRVLLFLILNTPYMFTLLYKEMQKSNDLKCGALNDHTYGLVTCLS